MCISRVFTQLSNVICLPYESGVRSKNLRRLAVFFTFNRCTRMGLQICYCSAPEIPENCYLPTKFTRTKNNLPPLPSSRSRRLPVSGKTLRGTCFEAWYRLLLCGAHTGGVVSYAGCCTQHRKERPITSSEALRTRIGRQDVIHVAQRVCDFRPALFLISVLFFPGKRVLQGEN